jgi:hypothetical protein
MQLLLIRVQTMYPTYGDSNPQPTDRNLNLKGKRRNDRLLTAPIDCAYCGRLAVRRFFLVHVVSLFAHNTITHEQHNF